MELFTVVFFFDVNRLQNLHFLEFSENLVCFFLKQKRVDVNRKFLNNITSII